MVRRAAARWTSRSSGPARATNAAAARVQARREAGTAPRSEGLAAFLTFAILLPWMLLRGLAQSAEEPWRSIANHLSFSSQLSTLSRGVLDLKALVFFLSVILFSLLLTHRTVEAQRWA